MPWKPGQSGNPGGRPKGAKDKLSKAFFAEITGHWEEHGMDAIHRVWEDKPEVYVQVISRLMPSESELNLNTGTAESLSTAEILSILESRKKSA